jgi:hypothetical protein
MGLDGHTHRRRQNEMTRMGLPYRLLLAFPLLGVAAFCAFGFQASFEPGGLNGFHLLYAAIGVACVAAVAWVGFSRLRSAFQRGVALVLCAASLGFLGWLGGTAAGWW